MLKGKRMSVLLIILICVILGVFGQLSMKKGLNMLPDAISIRDLFSTEVFSVVFQRYVFLGLFLYALASLFWLVALSQEELSFVYPLISMGYIFTAILSKFFFNESLTLFRFFGILMICGGVYLIVLKV